MKGNWNCVLPFLFILLGIIEAIWGLGQLYGVVLSRHGQFLLTGSFYNPGPYSDSSLRYSRLLLTNGYAAAKNRNP